MTLARASSLLARDPGAALAEAEACLAQAPGHPHAELIAGQALRLLGRPDAALPRMRALAAAHPALGPAQCELGLAAAMLEDWDLAIPALRQATRLLPRQSSAWQALAQALRRTGQEDEARRADRDAVDALSQDPDLLAAAQAMHQGTLAQAEALIRSRIARRGEEAAALRLLGECLWRDGRIQDAIAAVGRAVDLAPGFDAARDFLIRLLLQANRLAEALDEARVLGENPAHRLLLATTLLRVGDQQGAGAIYAALLREDAEQPRVWLNWGHVLKTLGQQAEAVAAYRQATTRQPTLGEAWWSLANLKTVRFSDGDVAAMIAALDGTDDPDDRLHLHFALGKALEDGGDHAASFHHYDQGNRLRRAMLRHDADDFSAGVARTVAAFGACAAPGGHPAADPIFIVGLPRSGSTLVEQILSSHSRIEGTMELPDLMAIAARLESRIDDGEFPDLAALYRALTPQHRHALGEEYLERTRIHRQTDKPLFIDKLPNNWQHVGLIRLILPHARVIDARRHPIACCFSGWKQHFARGQSFTYDLAEIGRYYRDYVDLMAQWDRVAPGHVHRVVYEDMIADTPGQVRALLDYLRLPFEPACLEFHTNTRAVRTASSEQVRRPINREGLDQWRPYEAWLGPLKEALGPVLADLRAGNGAPGR
jgi:tetratricopeptide (TPR) repeat protein